MTNRLLEAGSIDGMCRPPLPGKLIAKVIPAHGRELLIAAGRTGNVDKIDHAGRLCKTLYPKLFRKES